MTYHEYDENAKRFFTWLLIAIILFVIGCTVAVFAACDSLYAAGACVANPDGTGYYIQNTTCSAVHSVNQTVPYCGKDGTLNPFNDSSGTGNTLAQAGAKAPFYNQATGAYEAYGSEGSNSLGGLKTPILNNTASLNFTENTSFSMYVDFQNFKCPNQNNTGVMGKTFRFGIGVSGACIITSGVRNNSDSSKTGISTGVNAGTARQRVLFVYNATDSNFTVYVNGTRKSSTFSGLTAVGTNSGGVGFISMIDSTAVIGGNGEASNTTIFSASIWNNTLSSADAATLETGARVTHDLAAEWLLSNYTTCPGFTDRAANQGKNYVCAPIPDLNTTTDASGNGNILTEVGVMNYSVSGFYTFNGTGNTQLKRTTPFSELSLNGNYSVSLWLNPETILSGAILNNVVTSSNLSGLAFVSSQLRWGVYNGTAYQRTSLTTISAGVWTHVVFVDNGTAITSYTNTVSSSSTGSPGLGTSVGFVLGNKTGGSLVPYNGSMDDVRFFNRTLSAAEITQLYSNQTVSSGLIAYYPFSNQSACTLVSS